MARKNANPVRHVHPALRAALEFGPVVLFVVAYLIFRDGTFEIAGRTLDGFVVVIAGFVVLGLAATLTLWALTGRIARIQIAVAVLAVIFGALTVALDDPRVFKMKPTAIYLSLALLLGVGLWRGEGWVKHLMEDMIPLKPKGWLILSRRTTAMFVCSAAANELVWRTQSEQFWLVFETLAMPVVMLVFFLCQIGLVVEYATFGKAKKRRKGAGRGQA
ncbi:septation protein IspZ [Sulfitobacter albidus]|uniref:Septation protein IspZ n=1 Tax=Sulfitobacter albidus TaxID=2829501 RepID=A0A975JEG9_9RHOB|nr:septation protein IspZ [Sulfitobacter albidus]QUJ76842.1 septation protein IspZ [Sulfitobacter albidus]